MRVLLSRLLGIFRKAHCDEELDMELRSHLDLLVDEKVRQGMTPDEAHCVALRSFGGVEQTRENCRDQRGLPWLESFFQDLRYGLRQLRKNPGFTAVAVVTLALGIGANAAIFSVINAALLHPLPYPHAERLVFLNGAPVFRQVPESKPSGSLQIKEWLQRAQSFEETSVYQTGEVNLAGADLPDRMNGADVTTDFFRVLGVQPYGRAFLAEESVPGRDHVAVLSDQLCRRFGPPADVVGRSVQVNGMEFKVVGVMPPGINFPGRTQIWMPLPMPWTFGAGHIDANTIYFTPIARLRAGVSLVQARDEVIRLAFAGDKAGADEARKSFQVTQVREALVENDRPVLWLLLGAVGFVLLIACADVANLLLTRAVVREKEMTLRAALGASRSRLVRQTLAESLLLSCLGAGAGLLLAAWSLAGIRLLIPSNMLLAAPVRIDAPVLEFTLAISLAGGLFFGLFPSFHAFQQDLNRSLKEGGFIGSGDRGLMGGARGILTVSEGALSLVLLIGAGLLIRSFARLSEVNPGFNPQRLLTTQVDLAEARYRESSQRIEFFEGVLGRVAALPGVHSAAFTSNLPLGGAVATSWFALQSKEPSTKVPQGDSRFALITIVSPAYFRTMGIPLLAGRLFSDGDGDGAPKVAIISATLAQAYWGKETPLSKHISMPGPKPDWLEIVGVVGDTRHAGLSAEPSEELYVPLRQHASIASYLVVRTEGTPNLIAAEVRRALAEVDKNEPFSVFLTMEQNISNSMAPSRFRTVLLGIFAFLALTLAVVGLYGVMSYTVSRRTHEIGVRMAMGARRGDVLRMVVGQGFKLTLAGLGIGLIGSLALTRLLSNLLFGVAPFDPITFGIASLVLTVAALLAGYIPARRATRVDPMVALRYE